MSEIPRRIGDGVAANISKAYEKRKAEAVSEQEVWRKDSEDATGITIAYTVGKVHGFLRGPKDLMAVILRDHELAQGVPAGYDLAGILEAIDEEQADAANIARLEARIAELEVELAADLGTDWKQLYEREREHFLMEDAARAVESKRAEAAEAEAAALRFELNRIKGRGNYGIPCDRCGAPHMVDTSIPSEVWNKIVGRNEPGGDKWSLLCTTCIDELCVEHGIEVEAEFYYAHKGVVSKMYAEADLPVA